MNQRQPHLLMGLPPFPRPYKCAAPYTQAPALREGSPCSHLYAWAFLIWHSPAIGSHHHGKIERIHAAASEPTATIVGTHCFAGYRELIQHLRQGTRRLQSARPGLRPATQTGLIDLWRVDVTEADLLSIDVEGVPTNHGRLTPNDLVVCTCRVRQYQQERQHRQDKTTLRCQPRIMRPATVTALALANRFAPDSAKRRQDSLSRGLILDARGKRVEDVRYSRCAGTFIDQARGLLAFEC